MQVSKAAQAVVQELWLDGPVGGISAVAGPTAKYLLMVLKRGQSISAGDAMEQLIQASNPTVRESPWR